MGAFLKMDEEPDIEEVHTATGDACILMKVRCADAQALEDLLARIYTIEAVRGTRSYIVLSTYLERGPQADLSVRIDRINNSSRSVEREPLIRT